MLTATVAATGNWSIPTTAVLTDGVQAFTVMATDPAGNTSPATNLTITVDTTPPVAPPTRLDASTDSGVKGDNLTNSTTPTISGTGTAGDTITLTGPTGEVLTATVDTSGNWSIPTTAVLTDGAQAFTVTATDPAGNTSPATNLTITVDATPPVAPPALLDASTDSGVKGDNLTNSTTPTISGTGTAGDTITLTGPTGEVLTATVDTSGNWSIPTTAVLTDGAQTFTVTATDPAGNTSLPTNLTITVDATPPVAPPALLDASTDSGVTGDNLTNSTTPTISGTGTAGDTITLTGPTGEVLTATVDTNGNWLIPTSAVLTDGSQTFSVTATDPAGNTSPATNLTITVDATPPVAPPALLDASTDSGVKGDNLTNSTTPTISGTGTTGDTITLTGPTGEVLTATVDITGIWSIPTTAVLTDGAQAFTVTATDPAGNTSPATNLTITVDTTAPIATVAPDMTAATDTGISNTDDSTGNTAPDFAIPPVTNGETPNLYIDGLLVSATFDAVNNVLTPIDPIPDGPHLVTYTLTDPAGNESLESPALPVNIGTAALAPALAPDMTDATDTGISQTDDLTANNRPVFTIAPVATGDTPNLYVDGIKVPAIYDPTTSSLQPVAPLADGSHDIATSITDLNGNESPLSPALGIDVDTTPPVPTIQLDPLSDTGVVGDKITTNNKPTITGTGDPGEKITVTTPTGEVLTTIVKPNGSWSVTPTLTIPTGLQNFLVTGTDLAGNTSSPIVLPLNITQVTPQDLDNGSLILLSNQSKPKTNNSDSVFWLIPLRTPDERNWSSEKPNNLSRLSLNHTGLDNYVILTRNIPFQKIETEKTFELNLPMSTFRHSNPNESLHFKATQSDGRPLPNWMKFDPHTLKFSGKPPKNSASVTIKLTAMDNFDNSASAQFEVIVKRKGVTNKQVVKTLHISSIETPFMDSSKPSFSEQLANAGNLSRIKESRALLDSISQI